ncbi:DUF4133 domain-containing protein [Segetibacter sp. 3557_3]|uniref:DUF4133 domain-containing protein n=1 Tax=Segetibacter sp. 3557_3 TaxID=2547429 RepID=UPI001058CCDF|nr:DUF4133 domain-containing protein [Segetibacter sp. 3557_3]TDH18150.1 DUF4133 domain-containing protein [Segetibacter sp. 3557_3]
MAGTVYKLNKGINKPVEFKGLKAQYIGYLGIGLVVLLILFVALYISGFNTFFCLALVSTLGVLLFIHTYRMNNKYGVHGLMKQLARRRLPRSVKLYSRKTFLNLRSVKTINDGKKPTTHIANLRNRT